MFDYLLALSFLKSPLQIKLYLNIIPIIIGLIFFIRTRRISKFFIPFFVLLGVGFLNALIQKNIGSFVRVGQVFCMTSFSCWVSVNYHKLDLKKAFRIMTYLSAAFLLYEVIFIGMIGLVPKAFFGFKVPRYMGIIGESNYSALALAFGSIYLFKVKDFKHSLFSFLQIVLCASRTAVLAVIFFHIVNFIWLRRKHIINQLLTYSFLFIITFIPGFIYLIFKSSSPDTIRIIENATSGRFFLWIPYIDMALDNLFGIGYFQGWPNIQRYIQPYWELIQTIRDPQLNEQHNIVIQVLSEFGVLGHLSFIGFCGYLFLKAKTAFQNEYAPILLTLFFSFMFLNGLNEYLLYLFIGAYLAIEAKEENHILKLDDLIRRKS